MKFKIKRNQSGQGLVEYLVIVAIIAIGSIAVVRTLGQTIYVRFANITNALQNKDTNIQAGTISAADYSKKGMNDFFKGAGEGSTPGFGGVPLPMPMPDFNGH